MVRGPDALTGDIYMYLAEMSLVSELMAGSLSCPSPESTPLYWGRAPTPNCPRNNYSRDLLTPLVNFRNGDWGGRRVGGSSNSVCEAHQTL